MTSRDLPHDGPGAGLREEPSGVDHPSAHRGAFGEFTDGPFVRRVLIVIGLVALAYAVWSLSSTLLLAFGAILFAVIFRALAGLIEDWTPIPGRFSLLAAGVALLLLLALLGLLFGSQLRGQLANVAERLPFALNTFAREFGVEDFTGSLPDMIGGGPGGSLVGTVAGFGQRAMGALADLVLVIVAGVYLAADPRLYRRGLLKLFPKSLHQRLDEALLATGQSLKAWFGGQLISMALVGGLSALAYWWIGLPAPLALGTIAGVTNFIPFIGPLLGAGPAVLLAFTQDGNAILWVLGAVVAIQQLESNVILPIVERRVVALPPALALFAIVAFGVLFGFLGLFLAVPLAVVAFVLVKKLYVRETLGQATDVPGEQGTPAEGGVGAG